MSNILFITDGSILNPILESQGLPLFNFLIKQNFIVNILSIEKKETGEKLHDLKKKYPNFNFYCIQEAHAGLIPGWLINILRTIKKINQIISKDNLDLVHCRSLIPGIFTYIFRRLKRADFKIIYDNRGVRIEEEIFTGHWKVDSLQVKLFKWLEKKLCYNSDSIVVVSKKFKDYLLKSCPGINNNKIFVISNRTRIDDKLFDLSIHKNNTVPICVYAGSAAKWQSLNELGEIFQIAQTVFNQLSILILSYDLDKFKEAFQKYENLNNRIIFKKLPPSAVFTELSDCNFGILIRDNNLINNVSSPLKFAEYLSAGLPVMISEGVGDTEEIIENNKVGVVIRKRDYRSALTRMKDLLSDRDIYLKCRQVAEIDFNIVKSFEQYLEIYKILLTNGN